MDEIEKVQEWVLVRCVVGSTYKETHKNLYANFLDWCFQNRVRPIGRNFFGRYLEELGFMMTRGRANKPYRFGIKLKTPFNVSV